MSPFYDFGQDSVKENIGVTLVERTGRRDVVPFIPLFHRKQRGQAAFFTLPSFSLVANFRVRPSESYNIYNMGEITRKMLWRSRRGEIICALRKIRQSRNRQVEWNGIHPDSPLRLRRALSSIIQDILGTSFPNVHYLFLPVCNFLSRPS